MKVLVTTHAQMFRTPDGFVWTNSVYGYDFFQRYLDVFDEVRLVTRMKDIRYNEIGNRIRVDGEGIEFFSLPFYRGPWEYITKLKKIQASFDKAISGCDCAILRIPDQMSFQLFSKIKKSKIPCAIEVVAHSWELFSPGTIKTVVRPFLRILWDLLQKRTCKTADGVSYVTEEYIQKRYPSNIATNNHERFETFYTSANLSECFFNGPRDASSFNKDIHTLVHISGINNSAKGHSELLHALAALKEKGKLYRMIFVGGGTLLDYYKELSSKLDLTEEVTFYGHIPNVENIAKILKESDIFVFPTMTEGLPRVVLEAMASGLPCIATKVGGIPELLSEHGLVEPNNIEMLEKKILELSDKIEVLQEESFVNFSKVSNNYHPRIVQEKRKDFYNKLRDKVMNSI
jgi:L-malate glycosyltransferase